MEQLWWKIEENVTCPHCGDESEHIFYLNAEKLTCNKCEKEFNIELWTSDIEVRSSK